MNKSNHILAVLTGDLVESSKIKQTERSRLIEDLKKMFKSLERIANEKVIHAPFELYRGDSFQGVLNPVYALQAALIIRSMLRKRSEGSEAAVKDTRIAIGIGTIDYFSEKSSEGDGEAYRKSGPLLDKMKGEHRLVITTPWPGFNAEFETECAMLDAIISKWSPLQAEAIQMLLEGKLQQEMADELGITQSAVNHRIKGANWFAVEKFINRYDVVMKENPEAA